MVRADAWFVQLWLGKAPVAALAALVLEVGLCPWRLLECSTARVRSLGLQLGRDLRRQVQRRSVADP